jgi:hypothetical protein
MQAGGFWIGPGKSRKHEKNKNKNIGQKYRAFIQRYGSVKIRSNTLIKGREPISNDLVLLEFGL